MIVCLRKKKKKKKADDKCRLKFAPKELTFNTLWADSAYDKLMMTFLIFFSQETVIDVSCKLSRTGDNLHESICWEKLEKVLELFLLKI